MPPAGVWVQIDWLRFTGSESKLAALRDWACKTFGNEYGHSAGAMYFKRGWAWEPGVQVSFDHRSEICMIDIRGERLRTLSGDKQVRLMHEVAMIGMKPTRIDGAIDWIDQEVHLYEHALASCEQHELCGPRRWAPDPEFTADGQPLRRLLKLGKRDSPICVRIYDKGLQQRVAGSGWWERVETEWKDDRACQVLVALLDAGDDWAQTLTSLIVGAFDFRVCNGRTELKRHPRSGWRQKLVGVLAPMRTTPTPPSPLFSKWVSAFRVSYGARLLQLSEAAGADPGNVLAWLLSGLAPTQKQCQFTTEFIRAWEESIVR